MIEIHLTSDQEVLIRYAVESGRLASAQEAVREALALWEDRERRRAELLAMIDEAEDSAAAGLTRPLTTESMQALAAEINRSGRARLASQEPPPS